MTEPSQAELSLEAAAAALGEGVTPAHVLARIRRRTLVGRAADDGRWVVDAASLVASLAAAPDCGSCEALATDFVIVKYPNHDRIETELCGFHAADAARTYRRRGHVLEVVGYPLQSEAWLKPSMG